MSSEEDSLENLQQELNKLKKKKLKKKITELEKILGTRENENDDEVSKNVEDSYIYENPVKKPQKILPLLLAIVGVVVFSFIFNLYDEDNITNIDNNIVASLKPATFLDASIVYNASEEYAFDRKQGCLPILYLDFENHPYLSGPGPITVDVSIKDTNIAYRHIFTNSKNGKLLLYGSEEIQKGETLYSEKNFAGLFNVTNEITIYKGINTYKLSPVVPTGLFSFKKKNQNVCDYSVNK